MPNNFQKNKQLKNFKINNAICGNYALQSKTTTVIINEIEYSVVINVENDWMDWINDLIIEPINGAIGEQFDNYQKQSIIDLILDAVEDDIKLGEPIRG